MLYTYTRYETIDHAAHRRLDVTTKLEEIKDSDVTFPFWVEVSDNSTGKIVQTIKTKEGLEDWQIGQERAHSWQSPKRAKVKSAVAPTHYENFIDEYQWIDAMSRIHRYENPEVFKGAVELQVRKYLDRNGKKDSELQELSKGLFYYIYLVMYIKNGEKPIFAKDIHKIMEAIK